MSGAEAAWLGLGLLVLAVVVWSLLRRRRAGVGRMPLRGPIGGAIRSRLGGYRRRLNAPSGRPEQLASPRRVAVIGAGLGGISAAANLAERGFEVTLIDAAEHLGGKIGAWDERAPDGTRLAMEHGFHAFFRHYYNLDAFIDRVGMRQHLKPIEDYWILDRSGKVWSFGEVEPTPVLNLLDLARRGLYSLREVARAPTVHEMDVFLRYDRKQTFEQLDGVSLARFADTAELPERLKMVFTTFARAFFADDRRLSMAQLVKSFHFYYLSHDHGLVYDYPDGDYQETVLAPIRAHLERHGVAIRLGERVETIGYDGKRFAVGDDAYDYLVLATNVVAARSIAQASPDLLRHDPELHRRLSALRPSQRYAVQRLWIDRPIREAMPVFVSTERRRVLDAVAVYDRISRQGADWRSERGGSLLELHSYAVPDDLDDAEVGAALIDDLVHFFPELEGMSVVYERLQLRADFTALHVGMEAERPRTTSTIEGLALAGDWVSLPIPAMLMEAAYSAGLLAANAILEREGLEPHAVYTVPERGLLADLSPNKRSRVAAGGLPRPADAG